MTTTVIAIRKHGKGKWLIHYRQECDCGCTKKRGIYVTYQKAKPTENKAKQLIDENSN
ncbi:MAG TPA: hypothetical protein VHA52_04635 [Candidatus Babeliaceae bacterium]|nr:hypothetical protein [Candidatus Babeliaceae bacterium]